MGLRRRAAPGGTDCLRFFPPQVASGRFVRRRRRGFPSTASAFFSGVVRATRKHRESVLRCANLPKVQRGLGLDWGVARGGMGSAWDLEMTCPGLYRFLSVCSLHNPRAPCWAFELCCGSPLNAFSMKLGEDKKAKILCLVNVWVACKDSMT